MSWRVRLAFALARWLLDSADWLVDRAERLETWGHEHWPRVRVTVPAPISAPWTVLPIGDGCVDEAQQASYHPAVEQMAASRIKPTNQQG